MNYFPLGFFPLGLFAPGYFTYSTGGPVVIRDLNWAVSNPRFGWQLILVGNPWKATLKQSPWKVTDENF